MGSSVGRQVLTAFGFGLVATILMAQSASADWQYTQWGMSPDEVKKASEGAAAENQDRTLDADGLKARLVARYQGATVPFTAVFLFGIRDRLAVVTLNPRDLADCTRLSALLLAHYGPPLSSETGNKTRSARWNDFADDNVVNFMDLGDGGCSIEYSKIRNTRDDGSL